MLDISGYISDLLMRQDNLVVPNFGCFIARRVSARFSEDGAKVYPPFKQILFHTHLNLSDGVFERYVAHREKISLNEATLSISETVRLWHERLKRGERIELDKVGIIFLDKEKKIRFEQDRSYNLLLESYGLGEIIFDKKEIHQKPEHAYEVNDPTYTEIEFVPDQNDALESTPIRESEPQKAVISQNVSMDAKKGRPLWLKIAAAAVIIPLTFYSFWVPLASDVLETKKLAFSDFNPFHKTVQSQYKLKNILLPEFEIEPVQDLDQIVISLPEDATFYNFNYDEDLILPVRIVRECKTQNEVATAVSSISPVNASSSNKTHLISGCFSIKENADNYIRHLRSLGFDAYIVDVKNGLHRVAAIGVSTEEEFKTASNLLRERNIDFWALKK
jgi:hypothetical protein